ncbi:MAG TPA: hypothetical protein VMT56_04400 [Candidatus Bathyarchaeia archaeon]|nr:hypothetical protein [Candidatus Bathyarchaeia archaeon]
MPNSVLSTGSATGSIAMALVFKSGSNTFNGSMAIASDSCAMLRIMVMDSQAIEGTVFGPDRGEFSSSLDSLTNSRKNPVGKRDVLTKG